MTGSWKHILDSATSQGYRTNVVKPIMGMTLIMSAVSLIAFLKGAIVLGYIFVVFALACIIAFFYAYFYCLRKDPNLLRSEKYNLEKRTLDIIGEKGDVSQLRSPNTVYTLSSGENNEEENA